MTKLNTGLSGCSLELINDRVLRKYSPTTDYNSRLLSQADKQVVFGNRIYKNIDAPKVYDLSVYFQGCVWGGRMPEVIDMIEELDRRTQDDLKRDVIAKWHDESQMNKFFSERRLDVKVLHPAFAFPEDFASQCQFEPKMVHVSKDNSKYHK